MILRVDMAGELAVNIACGGYVGMMFDKADLRLLTEPWFGPRWAIAKGLTMTAAVGTDNISNSWDWQRWQRVGAVGVTTMAAVGTTGWDGMVACSSDNKQWEFDDDHLCTGLGDRQVIRRVELNEGWEWQNKLPMQLVPQCTLHIFHQVRYTSPSTWIQSQPTSLDGGRGTRCVRIRLAYLT